MTTLTRAQTNWLAVLGRMTSPLCARPGAEIASYKALANRGMATKEHWDGEPCAGWVITPAGREWLMDAGIDGYVRQTDSTKNGAMR